MENPVLNGLLSLLLAMLLVSLFLPAFRGITGKELPPGLCLQAASPLLLALVTGRSQAAIQLSTFVRGSDLSPVLKRKDLPSLGEDPGTKKAWSYLQLHPSP